jgi:hypothetical protein
MAKQETKKSGVARIPPPNRDLYGTDYPLFLEHWAAFEQAVAVRIEKWKGGLPKSTPKQEKRAPSPEEALSRESDKKARAAAKKRRYRAGKALRDLALVQARANATARIVSANAGINAASKPVNRVIGDPDSDTPRVKEVREAPGGWTVVSRRRPVQKEKKPRRDINLMVRAASIFELARRRNAGKLEARKGMNGVKEALIACAREMRDLSDFDVEQCGAYDHSLLPDGWERRVRFRPGTQHRMTTPALILRAVGFSSPTTSQTSPG